MLFLLERLTLGFTRVTDVQEERGLSVFNMISQHGYGYSRAPRIRYRALEACLKQLAEVALARNSAVHVPRIGCGQAGGNWDIVEELIDDTLCQKGISVTVYDLPGVDWQDDKQQVLSF